ncbi:MAG: SpoIIE family protein phosphatase [Bacteroidales bacterium]|nr:SpoIIE family protein phosphatase [Bacteroidales bacterium]MBN2817482.1 SpoIIE family protein phosphatase [Bacteroidales bacterium]
MVEEFRISNLLKPVFVFILIVLFNFPIIYGQFERFQSFDVTDGICHPYIYTINQDKNGFIWLGTGEGLCRFNGFEFQSYANIDSLSNYVVNTSYIDSFGDLWFGFNNGLVLSWDGYEFKKYTLPTKNNSAITAISQTPLGEIFIATSNQGCFLISSDGKARAAHERFADKIISAAFFTDSELLLASSEGLEIIPFSQGRFELQSTIKPEQLSYINIQTFEITGWENKYLVGTEDEGLYLLNIEPDTIILKKLGANTSLAYQTIQDVELLPDNNLWICTYGGFIKLSDFESTGEFSHMSRFSKAEGYATDYAKSVFSDREDNLWIGTYGAGVYLLTEQAFSFISFEEQVPDNNILSVASNDSLIWIGGENIILEMNIRDNKITKKFEAGKNLPKDNISALYHFRNTTWIGTEKNGVYKLDCSRGVITSFFKTDNSLGNFVNSIYADENTLYVATKDGIFNFDLITGITVHYNTSEGLPHNDIENIFVDKNNRLLFATRSNGIYEITERGEIEEYFSVEQFELDFNSITQDVNDNIWVSTYGQGIFLLQKDTILNFTVDNGLKSNYCYSIATADSNYIWVGHRLGLSRIDITNNSFKVFDAGIGIEGDCNYNAVAKNPNGQLFFGTNDGLIVYDVKKGKKESIPPKTNILHVLINDKEYDFSNPIVLPYSPYKLRIEFVGLYYNDPESVQYQYMLKGYDLEWSEITDLRYAIFSRVEDGDFEFMVRSFGPDGLYNNQQVSFILKIKPPFWKRWWFIISMIVLGVLIIIAVIKFRERRQKEIQEYLEKSLDERTREVVEQKEEIEVKNRDITDSINYAQRIQNSILPPIKKMQQYFSGSFIFYQPRDIVSGDFYWFDKISDDKVLIVCADSTGHGVPGAFMSMIGTTLIKDICLSQKIESPAQMLYELDHQLARTLNQNVDELKSNDGMDVMVCEVDINTNILRYASAMRPMIVYKDGEQIYIKGSRSSIGGQYDTKSEKDFEGGEMQLNKGDLVYLFSDGFPDQFGGNMGKKFKMVRLKNLLKDIHKKPMEEQYEYVKSTFNLWREDYDQVDDVLFMGLKI